MFRQTQFAEFELRMHEMAQKGEPITGDALAKLYLDITQKYYGHDQGVCIVDDYIAARVELHPALLPRLLRLPVRDVVHRVVGARPRRCMAGDPGGDEALPDVPRRPADRSIPIDLLKDAGVDMTTDEPLDLTIKKMNRVMDEMEKILAERSRPPAYEASCSPFLPVPPGRLALALQHGAVFHPE